MFMHVRRWQESIDGPKRSNNYERGLNAVMLAHSFHNVPKTSGNVGNSSTRHNVSKSVLDVASVLQL